MRNELTTIDIIHILKFGQNPVKLFKDLHPATKVSQIKNSIKSSTVNLILIIVGKIKIFEEH